MRPEEVYRSTFREIQIVLEGAGWRQEQAARLVTVGAWTTAALMRYPPKKRLPSLKDLLKDRKGPIARQTLDQQRAILNMMATAFGGKLEKPKQARTDG